MAIYMPAYIFLCLIMHVLEGTHDVVQDLDRRRMEEGMDNARLADLQYDMQGGWDGSILEQRGLECIMKSFLWWQLLATICLT
jgi:hypothetical protein